MGKVAHESVKQAVITLVLCLGFYLLFNVRGTEVIYIFLNLLCLTEVTYWLKNDFFNWKMKVILVLGLGLLSIAILLVVFGLGEEVINYVGFLFIVTAVSLGVNYYRRHKKGDDV